MSDQTEIDPIAEQAAARKRELDAMEKAGLPAPPWAQEGERTGTPIPPGAGPSEFDEVRAGIVSDEPAPHEHEPSPLGELREKAQAEGTWPAPDVKEAPPGAKALHDEMSGQAAAEPPASEQDVTTIPGDNVTHDPDGAPDDPELDAAVWKVTDGEWTVIDNRIIEVATGEDVTSQAYELFTDALLEQLGLPPRPGEQGLVPYAQPPAVIEDAEIVTEPADVESTATEGKPDSLFDKNKYDDPRLKLQSDGRNVNEIAISFAGTVILNRDDPNHIDVIKQAKIGKEMSVAISGVDGVWAGHADVAKIGEEGYVEKVTRTVKLKVTDVVFDRFDHEDDA